MNIKIVLTITAIGMLYSAWAIPDIIIRQEDVPLFIGTWSRFDQQIADFEWTPFDSMRTWWDLTVYPHDNTARVKLLDPDQGIYPAPDTFPNAEVAELDTLGSGDVTWSYMSQTNFYLYIQGIDFSTGGFRFLGNYQPDYRVYTTPMNDGASWNTAWTWQCDVGIGWPYQASEQHQKVVVAKGKVRVPFSGSHFWPCLVIRDYMTYSDNFGTNDTRWIYEWVVPGRFSGANGVAAAQSISGGSQNFMIVDNFFQLNTLFIPGWDMRCPDFANTTIWPDTNYLGPFIVKTTITDSTGIGADSLFYRINSGPFLGTGHDSIVADDYFYTIPAVAQPCTLGYLLWAEDSFSVANAVDIWNTDPICAPESTYYKFIASTAVDEYGNLTVPQMFLTCEPNPFTGDLRIKFQIPDVKSQISLRIFDKTGRLVKQFNDLAIQPFNQVIWVGSDGMGHAVPAGVYFINLFASGKSVGKTVTLVR
jgi:hypothetical protein